MNKPNIKSMFVSEFWNLAFTLNTSRGTTVPKGWLFRFNNISLHSKYSIDYGNLEIYFDDLGFFNIIESIREVNSYRSIISYLGHIEITDLKEYTVQEFKELYQHHQFNNDLSRNINGSYY